MEIPFYKKLLSYFHPVWIKGAKESDNNPELELLLYKGRWQLATSDAIYSDGDQYTPLLTAYKALADKLPQVKSVLVLGAGLGSAVSIMKAKGFSPDFTLVEHDATILQWSKELMPDYDGRVNFIEGNAEYYLDTDNNLYDLVVVDVFIGRAVPEFVVTEYFMQNCRRHLNPGGSFVLNYIVQEGEKWEQFKKIFDAVFPRNRVITNGINRILTATI